MAERLAALVAGPPSGRVAEIGGPQVRSVADLARAYLENMGQDKWVVEVPVPGSVARAIRAGAQVSQDGTLGRITWEQFLAGS